MTSKQLDMLIMVLGLPGSGKSYFSKALAEKLNGIHINSDIIRKNLSQKPLYTTEGKERVYQVMFDTVCNALKQGNTVLVDATFSLKSYRSPYFEFVEGHGIPIRVILIKAHDSTILSRLQTPRPDSDADYAVYQKIKAEFEPLKMEHLELASDELSLDQMMVKAQEFIYSTPKEQINHE